MALSQVGLERLGTSVTDKIGENKNLIINGAMQVAARGTSFTVSDAYTLDRYKFKIAGGGAATITQSSTTPDDFSYSYKVDITTADTSVANTDHGVIMHAVEGYNFAPANFGTSAAKTCKLSFYVRSNKTGTYGVAFQNSAQNRSCIQEYTINVADTWERKTITVPADTGGSWNTTNGVGLKLTWGLMGGSTYATSTLGSYNGSNVFLTSNQVNLFDNTSNEWYMTGAQLEIGSVATDFEHRAFLDELRRCQRYYYMHSEGADDRMVGVGISYNSSINIGVVHFPCQMRAVPTMDAPSGTNFYKCVTNNTTVFQPNCTLEDSNINCCGFRFSGGNSTTTGTGIYFRLGSASAHVAFAAEL